VEKQVPPDLDVHIILDNSARTKAPTVKRWLTPRKAPPLSFPLHPDQQFLAQSGGTLLRPDHGTHDPSWATFHSVEELESAIYAWLANWNNKPQPFVWKATADASRQSAPLQRISRDATLAASAKYRSSTFRRHAPDRHAFRTCFGNTRYTNPHRLGYRAPQTSATHLRPLGHQSAPGCFAPQVITDA